MVYLRELHLHVGKDMEETHNSVPQATVSEALLVSTAWALDEHTDTVSRASTLCQIFYLEKELTECIKHL